MDTWVNKNIAPSFARMYFYHVAEGFRFIISLFQSTASVMVMVLLYIYHYPLCLCPGGVTQMKYFLTSPDINEQKPPRLASSGPARIMTISVRLPGPGHWDMGH